MLQLEQKNKEETTSYRRRHSNNNRCGAESLSLQEPQPAEYFAFIEE